MRKFFFAALLLLPGVVRATVTTETYTVAATAGTTPGMTTLSVPFPYLDQTDLVVTRTLVASPYTAVVLTLCTTTCTSSSTEPVTQYSVSPKSNAASGTLTFNGHVHAAYTITVSRNIPTTQTTSFRTQGFFSPRTTEAALDKLTMLIQQVQDGVVSAYDYVTAIAAHAAADSHTGYALLAGRDGGQTLIGGDSTGEALTLKSNSSTDGHIHFGSSYFDDSNGHLVLAEDLSVAGTFLATGVSTFSAALVGGASAGSTISLYGSNIGATSEGYLKLGYGTPMAVWDVSGVSGHTTAMVGIGLGVGVHPGAALEVDGNVIVDGGHSLAGGDGASEHLHLTSTLHGTKSLIYFGAASAFDELNGRLGINTLTPATGMELHVAGDILVTGALYGSVTASEDLDLIPNSASNTGLVNFGDTPMAYVTVATGAITSMSPVFPITTSTSLGATYCGGTIFASTADMALTLPDAAATNLGCTITIVNTSPTDTTAVDVAVTPHGSDGIQGVCATTAGARYVLPVADHDGHGTAVTNPDTGDDGSHHVRGDSITLVSDGTADWFITACQGVWE